MKKVLFVQSNPPFNTGDYAFFTDEIARRLVDGGKAKYVSVKKASAKNVETPPEDKMVRSAEVKKK
jgi:hypothetical protein